MDLKGLFSDESGLDFVGFRGSSVVGLLKHLMVRNFKRDCYTKVYVFIFLSCGCLYTAGELVLNLFQAIAVYTHTFSSL